MHMFELLKKADRVTEYERLHRGEEADLARLFEGFQSAVDFPATMYYRELMAAYPDAKVVLTVRDPERWYDSAAGTILRGVPFGLVGLTRMLGLVNDNARYVSRLAEFVEGPINGEFFEGKGQDREHTIALFNRWNDEVKATVPADRLLVYQVHEGWEPLCAFLGVDVPDTPFPNANNRNHFEERTKVSNLLSESLGSK